MRRGARAVAQLPEEEGAKVTIAFRAEAHQRDSLTAVLNEETRAFTGPASKRKGRATLSKVIEYVVGLGLDLYWVRHDLGRDLDAFAEREGLDRRGALTEVIRRGLARGKK